MKIIQSIKNFFKKPKAPTAEVGTKLGSTYDVSLGLVLSIAATKHSDVKEPYYVEVTMVDAYGFTTYLPGHSTRRFNYHTPEWPFYHKARIRVIGHKNEFGHLLQNQKLVFKWTRPTIPTS